MPEGVIGVEGAAGEVAPENDELLKGFRLPASCLDRSITRFI
jgi:hypothetical protein